MFVRRNFCLILGAVLLMSSGCDNTPPLERILANGPGPFDADALLQEFTTTESGLKYRILRQGDGAQPTERDTVTVNYAGWLDNGRKFDSSYDRNQQSSFPLNRVVAGWTEGLQLVSEGGMIELEVPSQLGYGPAGKSPIPPNATLHFIVELIKVVRSPEPLEPGPQDPDAPEEFTTTDSGLKYRILRKGDGNKPTPTSTVTVHYKGWLDDDTVFDSSYDRGEPISFPLSGVVPGWTEGLLLVTEGGMIELEIPSELGYGEGGQGPIPPNATLHFLIELIKIP